jgi:hypothetical protein
MPIDLRHRRDRDERDWDGPPEHFDYELAEACFQAMALTGEDSTEARRRFADLQRWDELSEARRREVWPTHGMRRSDIRRMDEELAAQIRAAKERNDAKEAASAD